ncbi:MAG TPA: tRNA (adenine-N1)-methyltransferase [Candidatus Nitrosotalea sp.]|nr:tRNA (adenine-N1)-methyltransferase [Candidatus Nitrosotalea sp.]
MSGVLRPGEVVLLHDRAGRRYRLRLEVGATHSLHSGALAHDDLIGQPDGSIVTTRLGSRLLALRPTLGESVVERRRRAQPIYPKDLGAILLHADLRPGLRVLELGTGTGALTLVALRAVGPQGRLVSYELKPELQSAAREALEDNLGQLPDNLELKLGDAYEPLDEVAEGVLFDRVLIDLPEPWSVGPQLSGLVVPGGILFAHCPNVSQVQRLLDALRDNGGFGLFETVELLERGWTIRGRSLRPAHRMVAHTGFLTFARRLAGDGHFEAEGEGFF